MIKEKIIFYSNYSRGYVLSARSRYIAGELKNFFKTYVFYKNTNSRRWDSILHFYYSIYRIRPSFIYIMEGFFPEIGGLILNKTFGIKYIIDRADTHEDYLMSNNSNWIKIFIYKLIERAVLKNAELVVCRGVNQELVFRSRYYNKNIIHMSEGTDTEAWRPIVDSTLRIKYGIPNDALVIGTIGTAVWGVSGHYFGREIVDVLSKTDHENIYGVILPSSTSSKEAIQSLVDESKLLIKNPGRFMIISGVERNSVPRYLSMFDICISTQVNSVSGEMRTTAKLPDYMACGKYVLASKIGDARRYLPDEMLVVHDVNYYNNLRLKIEEINLNRERLKLGLDGVAIAKNNFDYRKIARDGAVKIVSILRKC